MAHILMEGISYTAWGTKSCGERAACHVSGRETKLPTVAPANTTVGLGLGSFAPDLMNKAASWTQSLLLSSNTSLF